MSRYVRAELYRLAHKKSLLIYLVALVAAYMALVFIRSSRLDDDTFMSDISNLEQWLPLFIGGILFAALFTDELGCGSLGAMVGYGLSKARLVVSKLALIAGCSAVLLALVPPIFAAVLALFGAAPVQGDVSAAYALMLKAWMVIVAFSTVAAIVAYGSQRATFAIVAYLFLSAGIVSGLLGAALSSETVSAIVPGADQLLASRTSLNVSSALIAGAPGEALVPAVEWIVYVIVATFIATLVFNKREMEF
jgi:ABC-type transport system involved in multi-copper enzyme maturation permease subunit